MNTYKIKNYLSQILVLISVQSFAQIAKSPDEKVAASNTAYDAQKGSKSLQKVDLTKLVSVDKSGDASLSIPIVDVKGRSLDFPITVNYQSGIRVDQKASEVGLGWNISFGSIVRDYGAFEPDYSATTAETEMKNTSFPGNSQKIGQLTVPSSSQDDSPFTNNKSLIYNAISTGNLTPDEYRVSLPGMGSGSFWNNGANGAAQNFVFSDANPWKVDFSKKTFEIYQEYSRINELTYERQGTTNFLTNQGRNWAGAICVPPYVINRDFKRYVDSGRTYASSVNSPAIVGTEYNFPYNEKVKYEDFSSFTITSEDGTVYVFGRALRGQKYLFTEDPFWSTIPASVSALGNTIPSTAIYGEWWKIDYIAEWLLTEIHSYDYVDSNGNGVADDSDAGDWIRIEYTDPFQLEKIPGATYMQVPKHREWMNMTQTDKASSLMRERAYVTKIVTPVQQIDFLISKRYDVDHDYFKTTLNWIAGVPNYVYSNAVAGTNGSNEPIQVNYPVETMKYDQVTIKERLNNQTLNTVKFNYAAKGSAQELAVSNYIIRNNNDQETIPYDPANTAQALNIEKYNIFGAFNNPYGVGRGKTTLLSIDFFPQDNMTASDKQSYKFEYNYNPSFSTIHKHEIEYAGSYPRLRQSLVQAPRLKDVNLILSPYKYYSFEIDKNGTAVNVATSSLSLIDEMGNYFDAAAPNKGRHAWSLSKLTIPTGGSILLEYENDQFDIAADRAGWQNAGSIKDDQLPHVVNYNKIAIFRSFRQSVIDDAYPSPGGLYVKKKTRTFNMPMTAETGGLRLKKKTIVDGINPNVVVNYAYGTGHYTAVPATYWQNYLSAFGYFMTSEQLRNSVEAPWYAQEIQQEPLFWGTDFASFMAELAFNIRLDNTVRDNHYYTYIEEINADNSKTRYNYGDPSATNNNLFYDSQKQVCLKGYERLNLIMGLTTIRNSAHDIKLLKTENFSGQFGDMISYTQLTYSFDVLASKTIGYTNVTIPVRSYPVYFNKPTIGYKLAMYTDPDNLFVVANGLLTIFDPMNPQAAIPQITAWANNSHYVGIKDNGYDVAAGTYTNLQSVRTKLNTEFNYYKGVSTQTDYTYESHGLVKTVLNRNSTKQRSFPDMVPDTFNETKLTQYKYAFESYPDPGSPFISRNMLTQKSGVNTYGGTTPNNSDMLTANVQTWTTSGIPRPDKFYEFRGNIDDYEGRMVNYSNFPYTNPDLASSKWQIRNTSLQFNRFGQPTLVRNNDIFTRHVLGYNSEIPKATYKYTEGWFDATYTGFEDINFASTDKFTSYILYSYGASCNSNAKYYVDNSTNMFSVGDVVTITPNQKQNSECAVQGATFNLNPFTATISSITLESAQYPGTIPSCYQISPTLSNYKTVICFKDPLPAFAFLQGATITVNSKTKTMLANSPLQEFWYDVNVSSALSKIVSSTKAVSARTGTKLFYIASSTSGVPPYESTPIRPILIKAADCPSSPCTITYKASCWIRNDLTGVPPVTGTTGMYFTYQLFNSTHTAPIGGPQSVYIYNFTNQWQYYEITIPITRTASDQLLDVYIQNATPSINTPEKIYLDDFMVYPQGAKYQYTSVDRFLNTTASTDPNDKTSTAVYDVWGRPMMFFDKNGSLLSYNSYYTTSNISLFHNYNDVTQFIEGNTIKQIRSFMDGTGKLKETCIYDATLNRRLISILEYDNQGRPIKNFNPYGETGN